MSWIRVDGDIHENEKLAALRERLGCQRAQAVGHMVLLWSWMGRTEIAWDGKLKPISNVALADAAQWRGDPDVFGTAVRDIFCDKRSGEMKGWFERQGKLIEWRRKNTVRKRLSRGHTRDGSGTGA